MKRKNRRGQAARLARVSLVLFGVVPGALTLLPSTEARAQGAGRTFTWTGSADSNWETNGNWDSNLYADSPTTAVSFLTGVANALSLLNASHSVYGITFGYNASQSATSFTIRGNGNGNTLSVYAGGITNSTALTQTIDTNIALRASQSFSTDSGGTLLFSVGPYNRMNLLGNNLTVGGAGSTIIDSRILDSTGGGTLTKTGTGTLTLSGVDNSFTGNIAINVGTLVAGAAQTSLNPATSVLGSTTNANRTITVGDGTYRNSSSNPATLNLAASNVFGTGNSNPQGTITINIGASLKNSGGQFNILPNLVLNDGTLTGTGGLSASQQMYSFAFGSVTVVGSNYSTISGSGPNSGYHLGGSTTFNVAKIGGVYDLLVTGNLIDNFGSNGPGSLVKTGAGTMLLAGKNSYTGSTTINQGTLSVGFGFYNYASSLGSGTGSVTINSGGTLIYDNRSSAGSARIINNSGGTLTFSGGSSAGSATITNSNGGTLFFSNGKYDIYIGRAGSATINNSGTIQFSSAFYDRDTRGYSSAENANITNNAGGSVTFGYYATAASAAITNNNGGGIYFTKNSSADSATITNDGTVAFSDTSTAGSANITSNSSTNFSGSASAGSATITNNQFLNFVGASTADTATVVNNYSLDMTGHTGGLSIGDLSGKGDVNLGGNALTVGGLNKSGSIGGTISGTGSFTKAGMGTLTLIGANTYSGGTTINAGTLAARGSALGTGAATVNAGGTLAVGQAANATRTSLASGPQSLSLTSLVVNSAANNTVPFLTFNLFGGGMSDTLFLTGSGTALSFSSASETGSQFIVGFASGTGALLSGGTYTLMSFSNPSASVTSGFDTSNANNSFAARGTGNLGGTTGTFAWTKNSGGSITGLQYTLIASSDTPEPGTLPLLGMGLVTGLGMAVAVRHRRTAKPFTKS